MKGTPENPAPQIPQSGRFQGTGLEMLRVSVSLLPVPASAVDLESNRIVALNPQFADSLHLPLESILDRTPDELGFRSSEDDRRTVLTGTANGGIHHAQRRTKLPDGNWVEYTDSSRRIMVDGRECLLSCYEPASRLVSEATSIRMAKELELLESEKQLRIVADMSLDMLSRHDLSGICTWASPACRQILHIDPDAVVGRSAFDFIYEEWRQPVHAALAKLVEVGRSSLEYRILRATGSGIWVETLWNLSRDSQGNPLEILCSTRDVTDQHQAQEEIKQLNESLEKKVQERTIELQTAMREMESFSYSISHDLRSPLRAIDGFSKALVEDAGPGLPAELQMYLGRIRAASQHMGQLIDDLLQLSRSSRVEIVRRDIDISAMATQILDDFCRQSPHRVLVRRIESPISIQGDCVLVRSVLENLLGNAWKYSSLKPESVIALSCESRAGRSWIFIQDNGIGFDMAHAEKLFGTFQRLHSLEQFEGTGIGLATVRKIVERHGGSVCGSGVPDQGAVFGFTLDPLPESDT